MQEVGYDSNPDVHVELGILSLWDAPGLYQFFDAVAAGHALVLADVCSQASLILDVEALFSVIHVYSCTHTWCMPTDIGRYLNHCSQKAAAEYKHPLRAILWVGSVLPQSMAEAFIEWTAGQTRLFAMYASTELGAITVGPHLERNNCCHTGSPIAKDSVRLMNEETGAIICPVERSQEGEILARFLPQTMMGYINQGVEEEEEGVIYHEGHKWWKTGDIGSMDREGLLHVVGRKKDVIKPYGIAVSALRLESLLLSHEEVMEAVVIAIPDSDLVEVPKAFVVLTSGSIISQQELRSFIDRQVSECQQLRGGIEILDRMPRISFGKVDKQRLRQLSAHQMISSHRKP